MNTLLISGTDTNVGKTVLTTALAAYWQAYCTFRLAIFKPIQTGPGDRELYSRLAHDQSLEEITPLYFQAPLAPPIAAEREGRRVELEQAWAMFQLLQQKHDFILLEALGGLGSPVTAEITVADLARDWHLPVVLVVPVQLGAIAQAVANVALARQSRVYLQGIVLNCPHPCTTEEAADWAPPDLIQALTHTPVLGMLPHLDDPADLAKLAQVAANLDLEQLIPWQWVSYQVDEVH